MPKLSENSLLILASSLILVLITGIFVYIFYPNIFQTNNTSTKLEKKEEYTLFNGKVLSINNTKLIVRSGNDNKSYSVKLSKNGKVLLNSQNSSFSEIKVDDSVNIYSADNKLLEKSEFVAEIIVIVRVTPEILKSISN